MHHVSFVFFYLSFIIYSLYSKCTVCVCVSVLYKHVYNVLIRIVNFICILHIMLDYIYYLYINIHHKHTAFTLPH